MKITVHRIITYSCRSWMSAASLLPAGRRFHSSASAIPEYAKPQSAAKAACAQVAMLRADLLAIIIPFSSEDLRFLDSAGSVKNAAQHYHSRAPPLKQKYEQIPRLSRDSAAARELHDRAAVRGAAAAPAFQAWP